MSFAPEFAPDAQSQWRALDPVLQELVLDEMEALSRNPPPPPRVVLYQDFTHEDANGRHYVFLRVFIDRTNQRITVGGVNAYTRLKPGR